MPYSKYLPTILFLITSMDIVNLRLLLKEEYSYQDTTKDIFLTELESIFKAHKNCSDTELVIYEGKCAGRMCENCGKKGYRFVGNKSKNYFDLLFETEGDDIKDIYHCEQFKIFERIEVLGTRASIEINLDDQVTFNKTPEYWSKVYAADKAWKEIITTPPMLMDFKDLCYWVDKNAVTDSLIGSFDVFDGTGIMRWSPFSMLYADLKRVRSYITNHIEEIKLANLQSKHIQTEQDLIDWLVKYEDIHEEASSDLKYGFVKGNGYFSLYAKTPIYFNDPVFDETQCFFKFFQDHFDDVFQKYSVYLDVDNTILFNTRGKIADGEAIFSLKFHLAYRKTMENLGIEVPFFLNKKEYSFDYGSIILQKNWLQS